MNTGIGGGSGFSKTGTNGGNGFLKIGTCGGNDFLKIGIIGGRGFLKMVMSGFLKIGMNGGKGLNNFPSSWSAAALNSSLWDFTSVVTLSPAWTNPQYQNESFKIIQYGTVRLAFICKEQMLMLKQYVFE